MPNSKLPTKVVDSVVKNVPGGVNPVTATTSAFTMLVDAYKDFNKIKQEEITKREGIRAQRDVALSRIQAQKEILQQYLASSFSERAGNFTQMFAILDKGLEMGDDKAISVAMGMIVKQIETNPLNGISQLMSVNVVDQLDDPDVDCIDI